MSGTAPSVNPLGYTGILPANPPNQLRVNRAPTTTDINANIGDEWEDTSVTPSNFYKLANIYYGKATWILFGAGSSLLSLSDTSNTVVYPSSQFDTPANNIQLVGGTDISVVSTPASHLITISSTAISSITIDGDSGSATGSTISFLATPNAGSSAAFTASGSTVDLNVTDANNNTLIGMGTGSSTAINGSGNTGFGNYVLSALNGSLTDGNSNTGMGYYVLPVCTTGSNNVALGVDSMSALISGNSNTAVGSASLGALLTGSNNTIIGNDSGGDYTSSESDNILISNAGTTGESNVIRIGTQGSGEGEQDTCFIAGIAGVSVSSAQLVTINTSTGQLGSTPASSLEQWNVISASQTLATNNGYVCVGGATLSLALPATSVLGDLISVTLDGSTGFTITQGAGQQIRMGNDSTTAGVGGSLSSASQGDTVNMVCSVADLKWNVISSMGNPTIV